MTSSFQLTFDGPIATLTIDDGRGNAINPVFLESMDRALTDAQSARVLIIRGRDKLFSGGLDIPTLASFGRDEFARFIEHFDRVHARLLSFPRPIVTCAHGAAIAGGAVLLCAGDVRLVAQGARVGINEVVLGLNFPVAAFELVRVALGDHRVVEAATTGRIYVDEECRRIGFATEIVPSSQLMERARAAASEYLSASAEAVALVRAQIRRASVERLQTYASSDRAQFVERWFAPETCEQREKLIARLAAR